MKLISIIIVALFVGCGTENKGSTQDQNKDIQSITGTENETKDGEVYTRVFLDKDKLPECSEISESQLAYILDKKSFFVCNESRWVSISIDGNNGKNGVNGENGIDGANGIDGTDGVSANASQWINPANGDEWIIGSKVISSNATCLAPYFTPTQDELNEAIQLGIHTQALSLGITSPSAWYDPAQRKYLDENGTSKTDFIGDGDEFIGLYCIK